jgi:hypothetical protein
VAPGDPLFRVAGAVIEAAVVDVSGDAPIVTCGNADCVTQNVSFGYASP